MKPLFVFAAIFFPVSAFGQVIITEIMYDLEGADTDREWVEIENTGSASVDISGYRLREANTNHTLTLSLGQAILPENGYAVIADNAARFLSDHPGFSGTLFDSSFSLSNTGETLILKDSALLDVDTVTYSSLWGGAGDGNSLTLSGSAFTGASPTPGSGGGGSAPPGSSSSSSTPPTPGAEGQSSGSASSSGASESSPPQKYAYAPEQQIFPDAGKDKTAIIGAGTYFEGRALGLNKKPLINASYLWNFGDGETKRGQNVSHVYRYPGEYVATLDVATGEYSNSDRLLVKAVPADVSISSAATGTNGFVDIKNNSPYELDLSLWQVQSGMSVFVLPHGSFILGGHTVRLAEQLMNLSSSEDKIRLLYPSGSVAHEFQISPSSGAPVAAALPAHVLTAAVTTLKEKKKYSTVSAPPAAAPISRNAVASVVAPSPKSATTGTKWFLALGGLILLSSGALVITRRLKLPVISAKREDEFEIIE